MVWIVAAALLTGAASGCAQSAEFVHPEFARFDVQRIGVYSVENATVYELRSVTFGGMFQRAVFGVPEYDLHDLLQGAIEESLLLKNYETVSLGPPASVRDASGSGESSPAGDAPRAGGASETPPNDPAGGAARIHDAELYCGILYWRAETGARPEMEMRFRVELYSTAGNEKLYAGTFRAAFRTGAHDRSIPGLEKIVRPAVRRAFADLPAAAVSGED